MIAYSIVLMEFIFIFGYSGDTGSVVVFFVVYDFVVVYVSGS